MSNLTNNNLTELHSSGYEISEGEPDIRGWKVRTPLNEQIGKVDELLFDTTSLRVRYLIIDLTGKPLNLISRDIIIPIGLAELDEENKMVILPEVTVAHLASLPDYKKGKVTIETERAIRTVFAPTSGVTYKDVDHNDPEFYNHNHFNDERIYKSRRRSQDAVDTVINDTENINQPNRTVITDPATRTTGESYIEDKRKVHEEKKADDRRSVNKVNQEGSFAPFQEGVIEITEHSERPVVSKKARVVEEVSINKEVKEHNEKVKDSVRNTEVDVERLTKDDLTDD